MSTPSLPTGYDVTKLVQSGRPDCQLTVGFDKQPGHIPRFLVQLHYHPGTATGWEAIARMDHNETSTQGHDVYREGLHVDVALRSGGETQLKLRHGPLPANRGAVIRGCVDYFAREGRYFIDVYEGRQSPGGPPRWSPDGGERTPGFIRPYPLRNGMSRESHADDALTNEELTELLADATDTDPADLDREARGMEIAPPEEAAVVDE